MKKRDHARRNEALWQLVSRQFLRAVRGKRSQRAFSTRLGYRGKPVADWESGRRFPDAATALRACEVAGIDARAALERFALAAATADSPAKPAVLAAWLSSLRGRTSIVELATRSGWPRFSVSRWLSGQSRPRLPQFLALVEAMTGRAADLVAELVNIDDVPALRREHEKLQAGRRLAYDEPWSAAILRTLETTAYAALPAHEVGWVASYLGIDVEVEKRCIDALRRAGMVDWTGARYRCVPTTIDTNVSPGENRRIKQHWALVAADRINLARDGDIFAYNLMSVSEQDLERIQSIIRGAFREIRSLVSASEPAEDVALVQMQLATWPRPQAGEG